MAAVLPQNGVGNCYGYTQVYIHRQSVSAVRGFDARYWCRRHALLPVSPLRLLWMPATPSTQGYLKFYFDGAQTGQTF